MNDERHETIPLTQFMVLAACVGWIAWRTWGIAFGTDDGNGILFLPAIVVAVHMGMVLRDGNRRSVRLDALCLGVLFLLGTARDVTRILAIDIGEEIWSLVWVELAMGTLLLIGWRLSR